MSAPEMVQIADLSPGLQVRDLPIDPDTVLRYGVAMDGGAVFPPIEVARLPDGRLVPWDGNHRIEGAKVLNEVAILANVEDMSEAEMRWRALGSGRTHALNLTQAEKRKLIAEALRMRPTMPDAKIAQHVGVTPPTVARVRAELAKVEPGVEPGVRARTRNGKSFMAAVQPKPKDLHKAPGCENPAVNQPRPKPKPAVGVSQSRKDKAAEAAAAAVQRDAYLALHLPLSSLEQAGGRVASLLAAMDPDQRAIIVKIATRCLPIFIEVTEAVRLKAVAS